MRKPESGGRSFPRELNSDGGWLCRMRYVLGVFKVPGLKFIFLPLHSAPKKNHIVFSPMPSIVDKLA